MPAKVEAGERHSSPIGGDQPADGKREGRLTLDQRRMVCNRPQRSAIVPPMIEPAMLAT